MNTLTVNNSIDKSLERHMQKSISCYIDIHCDYGLISIENRQAYCDRGRYLVKVDSTNIKHLWVDHQDMFPRYYFLFSNLLSEIDCWIKARNLKVISVDLKGEKDYV